MMKHMVCWTICRTEGWEGFKLKRKKFNPSRCVIGFNGSACPCYPFLSKTTSLTTLAPGFGGKPCDVLRAIEICPGILDQITGIWCGTVCWRNSMNVEALQIAIWGQETLIFFNWLEHIISPLIQDHYNFTTTYHLQSFRESFGW